MSDQTVETDVSWEWEYEQKRLKGEPIPDETEEDSTGSGSAINATESQESQELTKEPTKEPTTGDLSFMESDNTPNEGLVSDTEPAINATAGTVQEEGTTDDNGG